MKTLGDIVKKVRTKNAGPFWLTIDIFCGNEDAFEAVSTRLSSERIAACLNVDPAGLKRFDIASLNVVKFSLPRPQVQGSLKDRDMHGASWAALISELPMN